jgi:membrane-associated phospholipid phosphatase
MVRGQARYLAYAGLSATLLYLALFTRALLSGSAAWEDNLDEWFYGHSERSHASMERLLRLDQHGGRALIAVAAFALFAASRRTAALLLFVGAGGAAILGLAAKAISGLAATEAKDFPSGHACGSAGLAAAVVLLLWDHPRRLLILLGGIACVASYGLVLVATNWHSPSEVIGGWLLALAWVCGIWFLARVGLGSPARPPPSQDLRRPSWDSG